jgi:hypothetical protein
MTSSTRATSARNLLIFAGILTLVGFALGSPVGGVACLFLAGVLALIGLCFGLNRIHVLSLILLLIIIMLVLVKYPEAKSSYSHYLKRGGGQGTTVQK